MKIGKVWLVGAGPGDVGLLTLKGLQVLQEAEVVVYDSLVGDSVLALIPDGAEAILAGKRAGHHHLSQEEINQVLVRKAQAGHQVVRLKGGDPFLFGRGGEELEILAAQGIPYEVVPGVPSALAVPAYQGIPVTHRDLASSVHIITGHRREGEENQINYKALVETRGTLVFLMGTASLAEICAGLLEAGIDAKLPAALLQRGTTAGQKCILATVSSLPGEVRKQGAQTPAILIVGKVCALADSLGWYEKLPLAGYRVLVTRPRELSFSLTEGLRRQGAEVLELPAIEVVPLPDPARLRQACGHLRDYRWLVFTSPTGVRLFFDQLRTFSVDLRQLAPCKIAALGEGTQKALQERGFSPDLVPSVYEGACLGKALAAVCHPSDRILLPRAEAGNQEILNELAGFQVEDVPVYRTVFHRKDCVEERKLFEEGQVDCVIFTSASTVRGFVEATQGLDYSRLTAACIGRQTQACAASYGMQTHVASKATIDSLLDLVTELGQNQLKNEK